MNRIERIARALCNEDGRVPDWPIHGVPQWQRYAFKAKVIAQALDGVEHGPVNKDRYDARVHREDDGFESLCHG